ncbi:MAG TPA: SgcJ/EcaC family oxidoreductase [Vicinamibacterales bacterium]|nr:SgcJ/EcaC family oxidoreductase [Vicinamibacterales bacterium]
MVTMVRKFAVVGLLVMASTGLFAQSVESDVAAFFKAYDAAFNARDLDKLATMYHPDVTIFEGSGINRGWVDYRDNHLGPELKSFQNLQWAHSNIVVHMLGDSSAYVTADYSIKYQVGERPPVDSGGIATHVLVKEQGKWRIRHSHTAARRRAPGGPM